MKKTIFLFCVMALVANNIISSMDLTNHTAIVFHNNTTSLLTFNDLKNKLLEQSPGPKLLDQLNNLDGNQHVSSNILRTLNQGAILDRKSKVFNIVHCGAGTLTLSAFAMALLSPTTPLVVTGGVIIIMSGLTVAATQDEPTSTPILNCWQSSCEKILNKEIDRINWIEDAKKNN